MTLFLNFRTRNVGGAVIAPQLLEGDGTVAPLRWSPIPEALIPSRIAGANVLFATHGFNVSQQQGACALGLLDKYLGLASPDLFVGVLWPGDSILPIVDYPIEGGVAQDCGRRLAAFCNGAGAQAQAVSFVSHSLGARLVLEAVAGLARKARSVCLTAAAINQDCLVTEYSDAARNAERISILASRRDLVLKLAYSIGDPFAELLHSDHTPFEIALGLQGPPTPAAPPVVPPWQIADRDDYGHGSYLPPYQPIPLPPPPPPQTQWPRAADFMMRAFLGQPQTWPVP
ncbi:MAG TPA: alpha/beta hydrolase [Xanthobacteraceae bacterium]